MPRSPRARRTASGRTTRRSMRRACWRRPASAASPPRVPPRRAARWPMPSPPRCRAAALLLPVNVQLAGMPVEWSAAPVPPKGDRAPQAPQPQAIEAAAALLRQSRKPVILAGLGAYRAGAKAALEELAERTGALLATSARGKDMFKGHPCNLGIIGSFSHSAARRLMAEADCVLAFGASLNLLTVRFRHSLPTVPLIPVDAPRCHIGRWHPADVAIVGDARP